MPRLSSIQRSREMEEVARVVPKHVQKSLATRLEKLESKESITITIPDITIEVSCVWDDGLSPTIDFYDENEYPEDMLRNATDSELKKLGLSSIIELRERVKKEVKDWNDEVARLEKAYCIEENRLADFFFEGHYKDN